LELFFLRNPPSKWLPFFLKVVVWPNLKNLRKRNFNFFPIKAEKFNLDSTIPSPFFWLRGKRKGGLFH